MKDNEIKFCCSKVNVVDKTKLTKIRGNINEYYHWIIRNSNLNSREKAILKNIFLKCEPYILKNNFLGRRLGSGLQIFSKFLIKRGIFILLNKKADFNSLYPLLHLYEIVIKENYVECNHKTYQFFKGLILNDLNFCDEINKKQISNTPSDFLRMKILLYSFNLNKEIIEDILNFLKSCISRGYSIIGKTIKGVLAGALYLYSEIRNLGLTQKKIAIYFSTNTNTLRIRKKELEQFFSTYFSPQMKYFKKKINKISIKKEIIKNLIQVIDEFKKDYQEEFLLKDLIINDYQLLINRRVLELRKKLGTVSYEVFNKDKLLKTLSKKRKNKARIFS